MSSPSSYQQDGEETLHPGIAQLEEELPHSVSRQYLCTAAFQDSYYRRNYKDWFDVEKGNFGIGSEKNQLSKELQQEILQWIEKNKN